MIESVLTSLKGQTIANPRLAGECSAVIAALH
jgi:hypothetical protein